MQNEWLANEPANSDAPLSTPGKIHHSCSSQILALSLVTVHPFIIFWRMYSQGYENKGGGFDVFSFMFSHFQVKTMDQMMDCHLWNVISIEAMKMISVTL